MTIINTNSPTTTTSAADTPQPAPALTPDAAIAQVRALRSQLPALTALTSKERRALRVDRRANAEPIVQASLNVIGVSGNVAAALGQPIDTVRALQQDAIVWKAAEEEVRNLLAGIAGANAIRRQKLAQLGAKTRYRMPDASCRVELRAGHRCHATFAEPQWAPTPGQYLVVYDGEVCLGGAVITTGSGMRTMPRITSVVPAHFGN